jgi:hypothetical protein
MSKSIEKFPVRPAGGRWLADRKWEAFLILLKPCVGRESPTIPGVHAASRAESRAWVRVGEISLGLEKAQNQYALPSNGKCKAEQFARAGLSTSTAHRYEPLVGESMEIASQAASKADSSATTSHPFC